MDFAFDPAKDRLNRQKHGLPLAAAAHMFEQATVEFEDERFDYGEKRIVALGLIAGRVMVCVYTDRPRVRRIISLRKANSDETKKYFRYAQGG